MFTVNEGKKLIRELFNRRIRCTFINGYTWRHDTLVPFIEQNHLPAIDIVKRFVPIHEFGKKELMYSLMVPNKYITYAIIRCIYHIIKDHVHRDWFLRKFISKLICDKYGNFDIFCYMWTLPQYKDICNEFIYFTTWGKNYVSFFAMNKKNDDKYKSFDKSGHSIQMEYASISKSLVLDTKSVIYSIYVYNCDIPSLDFNKEIHYKNVADMMIEYKIPIESCIYRSIKILKYIDFDKFTTNNIKQVINCIMQYTYNDELWIYLMSKFIKYYDFNFIEIIFSMKEIRKYIQLIIYHNNGKPFNFMPVWRMDNIKYYDYAMLFSTKIYSGPYYTFTDTLYKWHGLVKIDPGITNIRDNKLKRLDIYRLYRSDIDILCP
jgi:hypothetical protein